MAQYSQLCTFGARVQEVRTQSLSEYGGYNSDLIKGSISATPAFPNDHTAWSTASIDGVVRRNKKVSDWRGVEGLQAAQICRHSFKAAVRFDLKLFRL
jgi:hypothetical protein